MWAEAGVYAAVSLALGYAGGIAKPQLPQHESTMTNIDCSQLATY
ncbi:hypothetical protein I546_0722 [Mycobacterium kansasii 732]|nr:hypothetical protein I546_0722 [Mycobacterium kansasii 732]